jgi:tripartite-type tricarboxylate transporter receptor subunit TctC
MLHLPLKGTGEIINELLAGRVQAAMVSSFSIQPYKNDPRLNLLAITDMGRSVQLPLVPTFHELGVPHFKLKSWSGLLAPVGTPIEKVHEINRAVATVMDDPQMKTRLHQLGLSLRPMSVAQIESFLRDDWREVTEKLGRLKLSLD